MNRKLVGCLESRLGEEGQERDHRERVSPVFRSRLWGSFRKIFAALTKATHIFYKNGVQVGRAETFELHPSSRLSSGFFGTAGSMIQHSRNT